MPIPLLQYTLLLFLPSGLNDSKIKISLSDSKWLLFLASLPTDTTVLQEKYIHFPTQPWKPKQWETSCLVSCQRKFLKRKMVVHRQWYRQCRSEKSYILLDYLKKNNANGNHMYATRAKYKCVRGLRYGESPADIDKILCFSWWLKGFSPA